jgi:hypothetical protein
VAAAQGQHAAIEQFGGRIGAQPALEQRRFAAVAVMPHDQRAVTLEEHRLRQLREDAGPRVQRSSTQPGDQQFRAGGLGQRREHRGCNPRGRLRAGGIAAFIQRDAPAGAREAPRDEAPAQAATQHGEFRLLRRQVHLASPTRSAATLTAARIVQQAGPAEANWKFEN